MSLSVRDALLLPRLEALRLRAGQAGAQHTVRWPYVVENESIADWVLGGELVFVTGINRPRDEANLLQLVREAHERACAGLVILTGPLYIRHIPDRVLAEADRLGVPLIEQPYELPLIVVTEVIGSALVQAQMIGSSRQQLIEQLLYGSVDDARVLAHRTASLSIDLGQPRQVVVLQSSGSGELFQSCSPEQAERLMQSFGQRVLQQLTAAVEALGRPLPVLSQADQWIALLPLGAAGGAGEPAAPAPNRAAIEHLLQVLNDGATPLRVFAGLSATCPQPTDLPRGLGQARQALMAARALPERLGLCCFDELGVLELLLAIRDRSLLDRFVGTTLGALLQYDKAHHAALTPTLEAWIQANGNLVAAAQRLHVHRNTLNHRMRQIQTLTGVDLNDAQNRLNIAVALMIWRLSPHTAETRKS
ncbi:PucR family transcriptional regulator ligand-binding domain-containing protein [Thauera sp.]|uniref:PucR family transcriptional regulator n=1 Tax=Thauera sp. TaxID=1905334 RepID=UPI002B858FCF|nr:PucR family transcriptional regulator ligand-binding domain-containing protein [Thauera sp.]HRP23880.1 PucR family transcriptional regulator ligand-binding domain-containing protein [Thauera sp.]